MPAKTYTEEAKHKALEMLRLGEPIPTIQFATGVPKSTLRRWRADLKSETLTAVAQKSFSPLTSERSEADTAAPSALDLMNDFVSPRPPDPDPDTESHSSGSDSKTGDMHPDDYADFLQIRENLMACVRDMSGRLDPDNTDISRHSLAISRLLEKIQWLDTILPGRIPEQTIRFEFYYDGKVQEHPPWHNAEPYDESNIITPFDRDHVITPDLVEGL